MSEEKATFAGGCFWCMEPLFHTLKGVLKTEVGYAGGSLENPTYEEVCMGTTGHAEVIQVTYDPYKVSYKTLLDIFWHNIDPFQENGQFCDIGSQYRTAIFVQSKMQFKEAKASKEFVKKSSNKPFVYTEIVFLEKFYPAEPEHQMYYKKHLQRYQLYHLSSGRENRLRKIWNEEGVIDDERGNKI